MGCLLLGMFPQRNNVMGGSSVPSQLQSQLLSIKVLKHYILTVEKNGKEYFQYTSNWIIKKVWPASANYSILFIPNICGRRWAGTTEILRISGILKNFWDWQPWFWVTNFH